MVIRKWTNDVSTCHARQRHFDGIVLSTRDTGHSFAGNTFISRLLEACHIDKMGELDPYTARYRYGIASSCIGGWIVACVVGSTSAFAAAAVWQRLCGSDRRSSAAKSQLVKDADAESSGGPSASWALASTSQWTGQWPNRDSPTSDQRITVGNSGELVYCAVQKDSSASAECQIGKASC